MMLGLIITCVILTVALIGLIILVRGMLNHHREEVEGSKPRQLSGREIEKIRRGLLDIGSQDLNFNMALSLVKTAQDMNIGVYVDEDPYIPADPYQNE